MSASGPRYVLPLLPLSNELTPASTQPRPPSPPSFGRTPETPPPTPLTKPPSLPVPVLGGQKSSSFEVPGDRSRRASLGGPRPKRKISPNGERILRGGFEY